MIVNPSHSCMHVILFICYFILNTKHNTQLNKYNSYINHAWTPLTKCYILPSDRLVRPTDISKHLKTPMTQATMQRYEYCHPPHVTMQFTVNFKIVVVVYYLQCYIGGAVIARNPTHAPWWLRFRHQSLS